MVKKYLATYDTLVAAAGSTPMEADIPFWFDEVPVGGRPSDREVMRRTEGVTVMAYRNVASGPDGTIALAAQEVAAGGAAGHARSASARRRTSWGPTRARSSRPLQG